MYEEKALVKDHLGTKWGVAVNYFIHEFLMSARYAAPFAISKSRARERSIHRHSPNRKQLPLSHLSVSLEVESIVSLPGLSATSSCLVVSVTLAQTTRLLAGSGETSGFAVLVNGVDDPVDTSITTDGLVLRVNEDNLIVLVG